MADSDSSEENSIHSLADVPVLRYADPRDPNAIYTFLGLATLPRLRPGNPLRLLPREMVLKIARFARDGYRAGWEGVGRAGQLADAVDVSNFSDVSHSLALKMPPMRSGVHYVEIDLRIAWFGTRIFFESADDSRPESFGLELTYWEDDHDGDEELESDKAVDLFYVAGRPGARRVDMQRIRAFNDCWTWCDSPVTFGCLVDMVLDCVTFRINGVDGPCVRFPGFPWRSGVRMGVDYLPDYGGNEKNNDPITGEAQYYPRCVVSCATPPTTPCWMLVESEHPRTAAEHLARVGPDRPLCQLADLEGRVHDFLTIHDMH